MDKMPEWMPSADAIGKKMCKTADTFEKVSRHLHLPVLSAAEIDALLQVIRMAGGLLRMQKEPASEKDRDALRDAVAEDKILAGMMITKMFVGVATIIIGTHIAASAVLSLSRSKVKLPSIRTFASVVNIPKGIITIYQLRYSMGHLKDLKKPKNALEEGRIKMRYGSEVLELVKNGASPAEIETEMTSHLINSVFTVTVVAGLVTQFALELAKQPRLAESVGDFTINVDYVWMTWDAYDFARRHRKSFLQFLGIGKKNQTA